MPFVLPFLPAIIGAAGSIGGALLNKSGSSSSSKTDTQLQDTLTTFGDRSSQQFQQGRKDWRQFHKALDPVRNWFTDILGGDRTKMMEVLGPEVNATGRQYDAVSKAISEFSPRGGGRTSALAGAEFSKAHDIGELFSKARPMAAQGLEGVAGLLGAQSSGESSTGMSGLSAMLSGILGMRGQDISKMLANRQFAGDIGQSLGRLLGQILGKGREDDSSSSGSIPDAGSTGGMLDALGV
jgi:hypothetical protein